MKKAMVALLALSPLGAGVYAYYGSRPPTAKCTVATATIARALVTDPAILLADEPTGNLDTRTSIEVRGIFQRLNVERGITVLVITHEHDIAEYGARVVTCRDGQIVSDHPAVRRRPADDEIRLLPQAETGA